MEAFPSLSILNCRDSFRLRVISHLIGNKKIFVAQHMLEKWIYCIFSPCFTIGSRNYFHYRPTTDRCRSKQSSFPFGPIFSSFPVSLFRKVRSLTIYCSSSSSIFKWKVFKNSYASLDRERHRHFHRSASTILEHMKCRSETARLSSRFSEASNTVNLSSWF